MKIDTQPVGGGVLRAILLCVFLINYCEAKTYRKNTSPQQKIQAVATTTLIADMLRAIGGDRIAVAALMGPGVDPHLYRASAKDIAKIRRAEVLFYNGLHLEGRMQNLFESLKTRGFPVYWVAANLPPNRLIYPDPSSRQADPHIWFDPELWAACGHYVATALAEIDPSGKAIYAANAHRFQAQCEAIKARVALQISQIPPTKRILLTSHDAFAYFGRAFAFQVVGIQGISTASEAGLADILAAVDFIKKRGLPAIFVESSVSPALIQRIAAAASCKIGGRLFSDATGPAGSFYTDKTSARRYELSTYAGMFYHNIERIKTALTEASSQKPPTQSSRPEAPQP